MKEEGEFKFIYQYEKGSPRLEMSISREESLEDVLEHFGNFLRGVSYVFNGNLEVVPEIEDEKEE